MSNDQITLVAQALDEFQQKLGEIDRSEARPGSYHLTVRHTDTDSSATHFHIQNDIDAFATDCLISN